MSDPIDVQLNNHGPEATWAAATARSLVTSRMHLATSGDPELLDGLVRTVAEEIFAGVPATPETAQAAERALSLAAALVHVSVQLLDGWADAEDMPQGELLSSLFQLLEQDGVTF